MDLKIQSNIFIHKTFSYNGSFSSLKKKVVKLFKNNTDLFVRSISSEGDLFYKTVFSNFAKTFSFYYNSKTCKFDDKIKTINKDFPNQIEANSKIDDLLKQGLLSDYSLRKDCNLIIFSLNVKDIYIKCKLQNKIAYRKLYRSIQNMFKGNDNEESKEQFDEYKTIFDKYFNEKGLIFSNKRSDFNLHELDEAQIKFVNSVNTIFAKKITKAINELKDLGLLLSLPLTLFKNIFLVLGDKNVATIVYQFNYYNVISGKDMLSGSFNNKLFIKTSLLSKHIKSIADTDFRFFGKFDLNKYMGFNNVFNDISNYQNDYQKNIFIKCEADKNIISYINNPNKILFNKVNYVNNIKYVYNLLCVSCAFYKTHHFSELNHIVLNKIKENDFHRFNYPIEKNTKTDISNQMPSSDIENLFMNQDYIVYGVTNPITYCFSIKNNKYLKDEFDIKQNVFDHVNRYYAEHTFYAITSISIYYNLTIYVIRLLRLYLDRIKRKHYHFNRLIAAHNFTSNYFGAVSLYSRHIVFDKVIHAKLAEAISKHYSLPNSFDTLENNSTVIWQEANTTNGKLFPIIQISIAAIALLFAFQFEPYKCMDLKIRIIIPCAIVVAAFVIPILFLWCLSFIYPKSKLIDYKSKKNKDKQS